MKKLFAFMLAVIFAALLLGGCDNSADTGTEVITNVDTDDSKVAVMKNRMERVAKDDSDFAVTFHYFRDVDTDVVYVFAFYGVYYGGGGNLTPLLKPDGTPYLWSEIEGGE